MRSMRNRGQRGSGDWETLPGNWPNFSSLGVASPLVLSLFQLTPTAATPNVVPVGVGIINEVEIYSDILPSSAGGFVAVEQGLFVGEYSTTTSNFSWQNPQNATDMCRDNWLDSYMFGALFPASTICTAISKVSHTLKLKKPIRIEQGFGLFYTVVNSVSSTAGINVMVHGRIRVKRVY